MVENWDQARQGLPSDQTVMITDSSNEERDEMNALAQDRRAQAGELGSDRVQLPGKPYGLAAGDEVIFTDKFKIKRLKRVENGITGTVIHANPDQNKVTIQTRERPSRKVEVDTEKFSELSLAYAVHIRKGQGLTSETSGILAGGWQTDREHMYVSLSRARERTDVYVSREDLGEQGMDTGAIERLGERMARSRAQEASITKDVAEPIAEPERTPEPERTAKQPAQIDPTTQPTPEPSRQQPAQIDPTTQATPEQTVDPAEPERSAAPSQQHEPPDQTPEPTVQHSAETPSPSPGRPVPQTARERITIDPTSDVSIYTQEQDAIQWLEAIMRNQGASHDEFLGEVAKRYQGPEAKKLLAEDDHEKEQKRQLHLDKIWFAKQKERIEREEQLTKEREAAVKNLETGNGIEPERDALDPADLDLIEPNIDLAADPQHETPPPVERDPYIEQAIQEARERQQSHEPERESQHQPTHAERDEPTIEPAEENGRDPYIQQAIDEARDRQESWDRGIDPDRENDRGFGIE
jgi:hypothetical protein